MGLDALFDQPRIGTNGLGMDPVKARMDSYSGSVAPVATGSDGPTVEIGFREWIVPLGPERLAVTRFLKTLRLFHLTR